MTVLDPELARLARVSVSPHGTRSDRNAAVVRRGVGRADAGRRDHLDVPRTQVDGTRELPVLVLRAGVGIDVRGERDALSEWDLGADDARGAFGPQRWRRPFRMASEVTTQGPVDPGPCASTVWPCS